MHQLKQTIKKSNREQQSLTADSLYDLLSPSLRRCVDLAKESGSSAWLTVLPIQEHGFHLHKGDFRGALSLHYGLLPLNTAKNATVEPPFHALVCPFGGFPTIRHNQVHDLTATLPTEVCHNVATEPSLQSVSAETFSHATANTADGAHLDVKAGGSGVGVRMLILM